jgi:hypothetical protein
MTSITIANTIQTNGHISNLVNRTGPLKKDLADLVLMHLFSNVHLTCHQTMIGKKPQADFATALFFDKAHALPAHAYRTRKIQPSVNATDSKDNSPNVSNTKPSPKTIPKGKAAIAALVAAKVLPATATLDHTSFKTAFPGTTFPHISMLNGLPKCNKATFNSLLVSKLRAAKTELKLKSTDRLDKTIVIHVSRLIDRMFSLELKHRTTQAKEKSKKNPTPSLSLKTPSSPKKKTPKQKKTASSTIAPVAPRVISFQSGSKIQEIEEPKVQPAQEQEPPTQLPQPHAESIAHLTLKDLEAIVAFMSDDRREYASSSNPNEFSIKKFNRHIVPLGPAVSFRLLRLDHEDPQTVQILHLLASKTPIPSSQHAVTLDRGYQPDLSRLDNNAISDFRNRKSFYGQYPVLDSSKLLSVPFNHWIAGHTINMLDPSNL